MILLVATPITAHSYTYDKELQTNNICSEQNSFGNLFACLEEIKAKVIEAISTNGYLVYAWQIPLMDGQCTLDKASWKINTLWMDGGEKYNEWQKLKGTLVNTFPANIFSVLVDLPYFKAMIMAANPLAQGVPWYLLPSIPAFGQAQVTATYKCPDSDANNNDDSSDSGGGSKKNPEPPCTEKEWCLDVDGDGYGSPNYKSIWSCNQPEPFEAETTCKGFGSFKKCYASKFHAYMPNCNDACDDNSNQHEFKKWYWDGDMDKKGELETSWYSLGGYSCGPPAGKKGKKGQWVNETGDACDDLYGVFEKKTWWWDQDKDNNGDIASKQTVCAKPKDKKNKSPWKEGRWILVGGDWCDEDPGNVDKKYWYWDGDFDGVGSEVISDKYQKPVFGCKPGIPNPSGQWVTKKGDECNDNKIPAHKGTKKKQEYFLDKDGDGVPSISKKSKPFCSDEEAKKENYVPKAYKNKTGTLKRGQGAREIAIEPFVRVADPRTSDPEHHAREVPQEIWDECDNNDKVSEFIVLYNDVDEDGFGSGEAMQLCKEPSSDALVAETGNDCDDDDYNVKDHFFAYQDADSDKFGDPITSQKIECKADEPDLFNNYKDNKVKEWVINKSDLSDIIKSSTMFLNVADNAGKLFFYSNSFVDETEMICFYSNNLEVECLPFWSYHHLCVESKVVLELNLPIIPPNSLGFPVEPFSREAIINCMLPPNVPYAFFMGYDGNEYMLTNFQPMGKAFLPIIGKDFFILLNDENLENIPAQQKNLADIKEVDWEILQYHIQDSLSKIKGPVPIGYASDLPYLGQATGKVDVTRRILVDGMLGPEYTLEVPAQLIKNSFALSDMLANPLIYIYEDAEISAIGALDTDMDYFPDVFENKIGTNPNVADTDNDGFKDMLEYLWSNQQAHTAKNAVYKPTYGKISWPGGSVWYVGTNQNMMTVEEALAFEKAKQMAITLVPAMMTRLFELYGDNKNVKIINETAMMFSLIDNAKNATRSTPFHEPIIFLSLMNILSLYDSPFIATNHYFVHGVAGGCGVTNADICVDLHSLKTFSGEILFAKMVNTLLHEVLHHVIKMNIPDPDIIEEHKVIDDVIGNSDISNLL